MKKSLGPTLLIAILSLSCFVIGLTMMEPEANLLKKLNNELDEVTSVTFNDIKRSKILRENEFHIFEANEKLISSLRNQADTISYNIPPGTVIKVTRNSTTKPVGEYEKVVDLRNQANSLEQEMKNDKKVFVTNKIARLDPIQYKDTRQRWYSTVENINQLISRNSWYYNKDGEGRTYIARIFVVLIFLLAVVLGIIALKRFVGAMN